MSAYQRRKGKTWEQDVARRFREVVPESRRTGYHQVAREGSGIACDVSAAPFRIECKAGARPPILRALEQARQGCPEGWYPIAVCKQDRREPTVTISLDDFLELVAQAVLR